MSAKAPGHDLRPTPLPKCAHQGTGDLSTRGRLAPTNSGMFTGDGVAKAEGSHHAHPPQRAWSRGLQPQPHHHRVVLDSYLAQQQAGRTLLQVEGVERVDGVLVKDIGQQVVQ